MGGPDDFRARAGTIQSGFATDRDNPPNLPPRRASAVVDRATRFYVKRIESVLQAVGTNSDGLAATLVIPPPMRERACTFEYKVRDTGSDRNWQNDWLPYSLTLGGNLRGIGFKKAHAVLSGGAELILDCRSVSLGLKFQREQQASKGEANGHP